MKIKICLKKMMIQIKIRDQNEINDNQDQNNEIDNKEF